MLPLLRWSFLLVLTLLVGCSQPDKGQDKEGDKGAGKKPPPAPPKFDAQKKYGDRLAESLKISAAASPERDRALKRLARDAAEDGAVEIIRKCLDALSAKEQDECAEDCLDIMLAAGFQDETRMALPYIDDKERRVKARAKIDAVKVPGLIRAVRANRPTVVQILLERGTDADARGPDEETALMYASEDGRTEMVWMLLRAGAKVNARRKLGVTALMIAASHGRSEVVEILLGKGAEVNAADDTGKTALYAAVAAKHKEVVKLLLAHKADATLSTAGMTAGDLADSLGDQGIVRLIKEKAGEMAFPRRSNTDKDKVKDKKDEKPPYGTFKDKK